MWSMDLASLFKYEIVILYPITYILIINAIHVSIYQTGICCLIWCLHKKTWLQALTTSACRRWQKFSWSQVCTYTKKAGPDLLLATASLSQRTRKSSYFFQRWQLLVYFVQDWLCVLRGVNFYLKRVCVKRSHWKRFL